MSFDLSYHWLLSLLAFGPLPWLVARRWPLAPVRPAFVIVILGVLLGQGLEPMGEVLTSVRWEPFTNPTRWRVFAEFMAAGLVTYIASGVLAVRVTRARGLTSA